VYQVIKTDGRMLVIDNPTNLPRSLAIDYMEEPIVNATIMTPTNTWAR
jgi:GTP-binding protein LepA